MQQDSVQELLQQVEEAPAAFRLVFSGKTNSKVNGLYKPDTAEIIIHNRNFDSDDQLIYTALHEYAHHILHVRKGGVRQPRPHSAEFWALFHELVTKAEAKGLYRNIFENEPDFVRLTEEIRQRCLKVNGELLLEMGRLLAEAQELCERHRARFEDYIERVLGVPRTTANGAVKATKLGLDPALGWDSLMFLSSIRDEARRTEAIEALESGASPTTVKGRLARANPEESPADRLLEEKSRIEKTIRNLTARLEEIECKLMAAAPGSPDTALGGAD